MSRRKLQRRRGGAVRDHAANEFAALIRSDYDKYGKIVREIGAQVD